MISSILAALLMICGSQDEPVFKFHKNQPMFIVSPSGDDETYALTSLDDPEAITRFIAAIFVRSRGDEVRKKFTGTILALATEGRVIVLRPGTKVRVAEPTRTPPNQNFEGQFAIYKTEVTDAESNARGRFFWVFEPYLEELTPDLARLSKAERALQHAGRKTPDLPRPTTPNVGAVIYLYDRPRSLQQQAYTAFATKETLGAFVEGVFEGERDPSELKGDNEYLLLTFLKVRIEERSTAPLKYDLDFPVYRVKTLEGPTKGRSFWVTRNFVHPLPRKYAQLSFERRTALWDSLTDSAIEAAERKASR